MKLSAGVVVSGRYDLLRLLGTGGMGSVWLARDTSLDTTCALKFIDEGMLENDEARARFEREAKAAAQIRSPNVVDVFEYGTWGTRPYIAMEYLEGEELAQRLERYGLLDSETAYRVVAHVARALSRAHAGGIVHRDLKPENIFLVEGDAGEIAKVLDFGIAKHSAYSLTDRRTKTGSFLGTPFYMSPEQARGDEIDHRSDLWALAVIAFQCLTGQPPFYDESLGALLGKIMYEPIVSPLTIAPHLPQGVEAWWEQATQRDREKRFQSAGELSDALAEALGQKRMAVGGAQVRSSMPSLQMAPPNPGLFTSLPPGRTSDAPLSRTHFGDTLPPLLLRLLSKRNHVLLGSALALAGFIALSVVLSVKVGHSSAPLPGLFASTAPERVGAVVRRLDQLDNWERRARANSANAKADVAADELFEAGDEAEESTVGRAAPRALRPRPRSKPADSPSSNGDKPDYGI